MFHVEQLGSPSRLLFHVKQFVKLFDVFHVKRKETGLLCTIVKELSKYLLFHVEHCRLKTRGSDATIKPR